MLNKEKDSFLDKWELDLTTKEAKDKFSGLIDFDKQQEVERKVSKFIQNNFSFLEGSLGESKTLLGITVKVSNPNYFQSPLY